MRSSYTTDNRRWNEFILEGFARESQKSRMEGWMTKSDVSLGRAQIHIADLRQRQVTNQLRL